MHYHKTMRFPAYPFLSLFLALPVQAQPLHFCTPATEETVQIDKINADNSINLADGRTIKLSGIDETTRSHLVKNQSLLAQLASSSQIKISIHGTKDRWGRSAAHVYIKPNEAPDQAWLQGFLLQYGHARLALNIETDPCAEAMKSLETEARLKKNGLWAEPLSVIESSNPQELLKRRGELVHVKGEVIGIGETRSVYYLNFGESWQKDLSIVILKRHLKLFEAANMSPHSLNHKKVYIRGIVDGDVGPRMEVQHPDQIEKLD